MVTSVPDGPKTDKVKYGEYLAGPLGHCMDCHTTYVMGVIDMKQLGHGGNVYNKPFGYEWAAVSANLTPDPNTGITSGVWTEDLFVKALKSGKHMGTARAILPPMPYGLYSLAQESDLDAIVAYLGRYRRSAQRQPPKTRAAALPIAKSTLLVALVASLAAIPASGQQPAPPRAKRPRRGARPAGAAPQGGGGRAPRSRSAGPWDFQTEREKIHVSVVTKGLDHPWGMAFLPNGDMLVTGARAPPSRAQGR
jgi:hypothetical protein